MPISTALTTARRGTVFLSLVCFAISYIALADLARVAGLGPEAYLWPVMIDGTVVIGTVSVVALSQSRASWSLLIAGAFVSITGNAVHAWITHHSWISVGVALTPPIFLLWTTSVTVELGRRAEDTDQKADQHEHPEITETPDTSQVEVDPRSRALELIAEGGVPFREIARRVGVDDRTVRRWRDDAKETGADSLVGVAP
ncbi:MULTISPECIES: helix-turn-helix domain-containing protein [unclassified Rhodococcus (in: high G+C Gram-positive bacteria)]|uniref:helix-turn-helix domain-containing protein n=1 Tax=unclassified Rhodococcus (in: high G+C Gram-positive bacteria) TaxID=192944 RepID=UPI000B9A5F30|nr:MULTISPECIES: helix-turn-helix domain-containing protein [unclassified Rhodococcus (in: high G+C Gram-positive bacteria)]OZE35573.1 hypothetical protein CH259_16220 [Rhodococcus sp. 05-2254-4]OZE48002.1 hypothetical protein CH261_08815 [Rhodococcus sp. 05-2254-3]OZE49213.1 hypothetical protein CH283_16600 [Rhodococcus sp. 05-2254-2]